MWRRIPRRTLWVWQSSPSQPHLRGHLASCSTVVSHLAHQPQWILGAGQASSSSCRHWTTSSRPKRSKKEKREKRANERAKQTRNKQRRKRAEREDSAFQPLGSGGLLRDILSAAPVVEASTTDTTVAATTTTPSPVAVDTPEFSRRCITAEILPYCFGGNVTWREVVVNSIREEFLTSDGNRKAAWLRDAKDWYHNSLPSFRERLQQGDYPAHVGDALDRLAQEGFDSDDFQKHFRSFPRYRYRVSKLAQQITEQEQIVEKRRLKVAMLQMTMDNIQEQIDEDFVVPEDPPASNQDNNNSETYWQVAWNSVRSIMSSKNASKSVPSQQKEKAPRASQKKFKNTKELVRTWDKRQKEMHTLQEALSEAQQKLDNLRNQRKAAHEPMTSEDFDQAEAAMEEVMPEFCRFLAQHIIGRHRVVLERYKVLDEQTDLTRPQEWFPHARLDKRKIIFHAGPTNSGKTYQALERLKQAKKGIYYGPLRLLAAEIYETLTSEGIYCNLYTGQEKRELPFATHGAATVEMASIIDDFDVVVIDEIQMIEDFDRGYAWTRAFLGSRCKEIHVCGGAEAEPILRKLTEACGDELEVVRYKRFSALTVQKKSIAKSTSQLEAYQNVERGDCVVAFSRADIFAIKREIERLTNFKCCVVYGSLPPQTRSEQARLFNDPDSGYDILVASDAVGMGLNLNIRRIIFNTIYKNDGRGIIRLGHSAIKQIAGRAGRRNSIFPDGIITCRSPDDMGYLKACMATEINPIKRAGLLPTARHFEIFDSTLQEYGKEGTQSKLLTILGHFGEMASIRNDYFLGRQEDMRTIARVIDKYALLIRDKYTLCMCPVSTNNGKSLEVLSRFAAKLSVGEVSGLPNKTIPREPKTFDDLAVLCGIFTDLDLFLWLQNKFPPGNLIEQQNALALKETTIKMVGEALRNTRKLRLKHCYVDRDKYVRSIWKRKQRSLQKDEEKSMRGKGHRNGVVEEDDPDWNKISNE